MVKYPSFQGENPMFEAFKKYAIFLLIAFQGILLNASEDYCAAPGGKVDVFADYLWWQVREDNTDFGILNTVTRAVDTDGETITTLSTALLRSKFDWRPGVRGGICYIAPGDMWKISAIGTHFKSTAKSSHILENYNPETNFIDVTNNGVVVEIPGFQPASEAHEELHINIDWADIDFSKPFMVSSCFYIEPHIGARSIWINQHSEITALMPNSVDGPGATLASKIKQRFWGYGLEAGIKGSWNIGGGLSLRGDLTTSILYSEYKISSHPFEIITEDIHTILSEKIHETDKIHTATPMLDLSLLLVYDMALYNHPLEIHVGWDQHVIFNGNRAVRGGNLSFQGVSAGLAFSY